jgi:hypothetical protein
MHRKFVHLGAALAIAAVIAAYGVYHSSPRGSPQAAQQTTPSSAAPVAASSSRALLPAAAASSAAPITYAPPAEVVLGSAGRSPRRELRYVFQNGEERRTNLVITRRSEFEINGRSLTLPGSESGGTDLEVLTRSSGIGVDGSVERTTSLEHVRLRSMGSANPRFQTAAAAVEQKMKRSAFTDLIDPRGRLRTADNAGSVDSVTDLGQGDSSASTLRLFTIPFPKESIGVGARWSAKSEIVLMGFQVTQTLGYELVEFHDGKGRVKQTVSQLAAPGQLPRVGPIAALKSELVAMTASGKGELAFELNGGRMTGRIETTTLLTLRAKGGGTPATTTLELHVSAEASPKD